ncbi:hypothetical protein N0V84_005315 [Fusarium piperis]|uniref:Uncharacterized protein n=1 Tax=Fusarium piperis TaxID=1435070 RepID=A0A9W8WE08_9HYPO|nr:hypothetical protein N0V84_005315 [Fusarium piperis]
MPFNNIVPGLEIAYSVIDDIRGDDSESQDDERLLPVSSNPEDLGQDSDDEVVENRPQRSPYASDIVALRFSPSQTLRIPRQFLEKTPLAARCEPLNEINLESIQFDAGHVIVNFLVTGRYQCLEPWASTAAGKYSSEFRTALRVYMAAESLGLMDLLKVAQEEVKKAGDKLGFPQVVDNVHFLDPFHAHFPWIGEYIQSRMVSFLESTTIEQATKMTSDVLGPSNLHKILIGGLLKMKASGWERQRGSTISTDRISKVNTSVKDMRKMLREEREKLSASRSTMDLIDPTDAMGLRSRKPDVQGPNPRLHQPQPSMPKVTFVPESRRSMKEVENEAVSEQAELRTLLSKRLDSEETPLGFSWSDQNRLNLLKLKGERRAEVLAAERAWCQIEQKDEEAEAAFKNAVRNGK